jgi:hypothetical protein
MEKFAEKIMSANNLKKYTQILKLKMKINLYNVLMSFSILLMQTH